MGHAGVMTVAEAKLHATRTIITHPPYKAPGRIHAEDGDDAPRKKKSASGVCFFFLVLPLYLRSKNLLNHEIPASPPSFSL